MLNLNILVEDVLDNGELSVIPTDTETVLLVIRGKYQVGSYIQDIFQIVQKNESKVWISCFPCRNRSQNVLNVVLVCKSNCPLLRRFAQLLLSFEIGLF